MVRDVVDLEFRRNVGESGSEKVRVRSRRLISLTVTFVLRSQPVHYSRSVEACLLYFSEMEEKQVTYFIEDEWHDYYYRWPLSTREVDNRLFFISSRRSLVNI